MITDLAQQIGQILTVVAVVGLLGLAVHCLVEGVREGLAWRRLSQRISKIAREEAEQREHRAERVTR